jgi:hypothetical protein
MAERRRTGSVTHLATLSVCVWAVSGPGGCSSSSEANPGSTSAGATASMDAAIGCAADPRGEAFTPNLTHKGDAGQLSFVIAGANFSPPAVDNNTWTLKILDGSGQPVSDAVLTFPARSNPSDPWMPDHSHGALPAKAVNNQDGTYTVAPLYFFMGGIWSTFISAQAGSVTDSTTFTFCVGS